MKRVIYEWGVIASAALSAVSIVYFAVSLVSDSADFELSFGDVPATGMQVRAADGQITVCDHLGNLEIIDLVNKSGAVTPAVVSSLGWNNSVLGARYITFTSDFSVWSLNTSVLIPALSFAALGYFSYRRCRCVNLQRSTWDRIKQNGTFDLNPSGKGDPSIPRYNSLRKRPWCEISPTTLGLNSNLRHH